MRHSEHWTAVSTLLGLISSAHHDLHHWRSNQQSPKADAETLPLGHRFISYVSDAELITHGDNARRLNLMCLEGTYSLQRTRSTPGLRLLQSVLWIHITLTSWTGTILYLYLNRRIDVIFELSRLENLANTYMRHTEHWTAVSTLLGLISSAYICLCIGWHVCAGVYMYINVEWT